MNKNMLAKAIALAAQAFENKTDKSGEPYILHCLRVMNGVAPDPELMQMAILHDIVEDTETSLQDLRDMGFSERVVEGISLLTHRHEQSYDDYIKTISGNKDATTVKLADLRDNTNITRLKSLRPKDLERLEKYHRAYTHLNK
ncbi:HD domain-containing protein [Chitinophagaceae bacterium MMS25-I14]